MALDDHALSLNLGFPATSSSPAADATNDQKPTARYNSIVPLLTLSLSGGGGGVIPNSTEDEVQMMMMKSAKTPSNYSQTISSVKRERDAEEIRSFRSDEDEEEGDVTPTYSTSSEISVRKKLRLSKDQSDFLEQRFKQHSTLNPKQKQALANRLNLRPRQVEVWFQNRRARTKLKQTEVDYELLKQCCETLKDENRKLQNELQQLRTAATKPPTTLSLCPSCERVHGEVNGVMTPAVERLVKKSRFFSSFRSTKTTATEPSAAC